MKNKEIEEFDKKQLEELLKRLKDINNFTGFKDGAFKYYLGKYEADLLLSYIEQLELCYCNRTDCSSRIKDSKKYDSLLQKYKQLEKNRDKAIEYVKEFRFATVKFEQHSDTLLNILKGDSDDTR